MPDRIARRTNRYRSAVDLDVAGREPICPEDGSCEFGPPGSDQSGDPDDLAGANLKVNPVQHCRTGGPPSARRVNATHRKAHRACLMAHRRAAVKLRSGAADHELDDRRDRQSLTVPHGGQPAVSKDRQAVADRHRLLEPVRDEHDRYAARSSPPWRQPGPPSMLPAGRRSRRWRRR